MSEKAVKAVNARITHNTRRGAHGKAGLDGCYWKEPTEKRHKPDVSMKCAACDEQHREGLCHKTAKHCAATAMTTASQEKVNRMVQVIATVGDAREKISSKRKVTANDMKRIARAQRMPMSTLYRWRSRAIRGVLLRKAGSGRRVSVTTDSACEWLSSFVRQHCGFVTIPKIVRAMKQQLHCGCTGTVQKLLHKLGFHRVRQRIAPLLTEMHKQRRLAWVRDMLSRPEETRFGSADEVLVHCDEKWFWGMHVRHVWQSPQVIAPALTAVSKNHLLKEMFLAAVARPLPEHEFDGAVGIWPVVKQKIAQHASSRHARGDVYDVSCTMDTSKFIDMMKTLVVPATLRKCGTWASKITFQFDSAGGHGGGRGDINATTVAELNAWAADLPSPLIELCNGHKPNIVFVTQPTRSPDLNVLDLGAWHSLQVAVDNYKHDNGIRADNVEDLRKLVLDTWTSLTSAATLSALFTTLDRVFHLIEEVQGGNAYSIRHLHHN